MTGPNALCGKGITHQTPSRYIHIHMGMGLLDRQGQGLPLYRGAGVMMNRATGGRGYRGADAKQGYRGADAKQGYRGAGAQGW